MLSSMQKKEDAFIEKQNGTLLGPYKSVFAGDTIIVWDPKADVEEGDVVLRKLPNGRDERSEVTTATFYDTGRMQPHYQLKFRKGGAEKMAKPGSTIHIHGIHGGQVQIGDHNTQNIVNALQELQNRIDRGDGTPEQKLEAQGLLSTLLAHPLVISVLGGLSGGVIGG